MQVNTFEEKGEVTCFGVLRLYWESISEFGVAVNRRWTGIPSRGDWAHVQWVDKEFLGFGDIPDFPETEKHGLVCPSFVQR